MMRVLVADDDPLVCHAVCALVRAFGYEVLIAEDGLQAWEVIQRENIALLITDWQMPGLDGPSLIRRIRAAPLPHYISCLLLTVRDQRTDRIHGLDAGADDYLVKPVDPDELRARLAVASRIFRLEQDLREANTRLQELANEFQYQADHDPLTGLFNRQGVVSQAHLELNRAKRTGQMLAIALLDIDHFKQVNDRYGHIIGDQALIHVASLLRSVLRSYDRVGRWGGEEFLVLLPGTSVEASCCIAERMREQIATQPLVLPNHQQIALQMSIGVANTSAELPDLDALVAAADHALYAAKHRGRNRVVCYAHLRQT
ncbi:diguanylate cyclase [Candidatus Chloroploca sp. Khr17]|uniref:GGDEF domain-containing response regulator n=1 Tax=Candidatus Chloroploca sp. Khr17 TaxID=2496869 RepID=UPI00101CFE3F|nr:diguanylate cyclase [Candidatus Chloroploca sp. Khr17]